MLPPSSAVRHFPRALQSIHLRLRRRTTVGGHAVAAVLGIGQPKETRRALGVHGHDATVCCTNIAADHGLRSLLQPEGGLPAPTTFPSSPTEVSHVIARREPVVTDDPADNPLQWLHQFAPEGDHDDRARARRKAKQRKGRVSVSTIFAISSPRMPPGLLSAGVTFFHTHDWL